VLSFLSEAREVLIAVHTVQVSAADQAISRFATGTSGKAQTQQSTRESESAEMPRRLVVLH
jgi:hypothetical protein